MNTREERNLSVRLAILLLLQKGEISLTEIEALPLVRTAREAEEVAELVGKILQIDRITRKKSDSPIARWEEVLVLKESVGGPSERISLNPLEPEEAIRAALQVKSKPSEQKKASRSTFPEHKTFSFSTLQSY